jgi:hypothetical protein
MQIRDDRGRFMDKLKARFFDGQIVTTTPKHYSQNETIMVVKPTFSNIRGWIYGNNFCHYDRKEKKIIVQGGSSFWNEEELFTKITDPEIKLAVEIFYREQEIKELLKRIDALNEELTRLKYTQEILIERNADVEP